MTLSIRLGDVGLGTGELVGVGAGGVVIGVVVGVLGALLVTGAFADGTTELAAVGLVAGAEAGTGTDVIFTDVIFLALVLLKAGEVVLLVAV